MAEEPKNNEPIASQSQAPQQEVKPSATAAEISNALNQTSHEELSERPSLEYKVISSKK
jgi:hypothetical protein